MRKYFYPLVAVAALAFMSLGANKANAQYVQYSSGYNNYYAPSYGYNYAPSYGYAYAPAYYPNTSYYYPSTGYYQPSGVSVSFGTGYYGRGYSPGYYGGYGRSYSGYSVGVGPFSYSNYRFGGRRWR